MCEREIDFVSIDLQWKEVFTVKRKIINLRSLYLKSHSLENYYLIERWNVSPDKNMEVSRKNWLTKNGKDIWAAGKQ